MATKTPTKRKSKVIRTDDALRNAVVYLQQFQ